jgi:hypothetical protein
VSQNDFGISLYGNTLRFSARLPLANRDGSRRSCGRVGGVHR